MSAAPETEVDWVLEQLGDVVTSVGNDYSLDNGDPVTVKRINRDESEVYDGDAEIDMLEPIKKRKEYLTSGVLAAAGLTGRSGDPVGTEYDRRLDTVVQVQLEGLTNRQYGHVDPRGEKGVPWDVLRRRVQRTLLESRSYPDTDVPNTAYHDLLVTNDSPQSFLYRDYYQYTFDVVLRGYETLP